MATEGEINVSRNLKRKANAADRMFTALMGHMREAIEIGRTYQNYTNETEVPVWL